MGDLRNQLRKANLLSKKDAKRIAHEERIHRKAVGGASGVEREQEERAAQLRAQRDAQRAADRDQQAAVQAKKDAAGEVAACEALLRSQVQRPGRQGASRWYFPLADGRLPFLDLPMAERMQVSEGTLCVVRVGPKASHDYGLIVVHHARRIAAALPGRVVYAAVALVEG